MKTPILLFLCAAFACTANAQFSLVPQIGFENTRTTVALNKGASFLPLGDKLSPQAAVRLSYNFKKIGAPFIGLATSRSIVEYSFANPETGNNAYTALRGGTQLRFEGGYQVSTKRIYLKKTPVAKSSWSSHCQRTAPTSMCERYRTYSSCGRKTNEVKTFAKHKDTRTWMRIQPSLGIAYIPGAPRSSIYTKSTATQPEYAYNAGNWTTAVLSGVNFQFGKAAQSTFNISLNYVKGLGMETQSVTIAAGNKPTVTSLKSDVSGWNLRVGIPISFTKKQPPFKQQFIKEARQSQHRCGQFKSQYGGRCTGKI